MRPVVLLASFVLIIVVQISSAKWCPYRETCLKELGYDESILDGAYGSGNKIKEGDEKINKYTACCFIKLGFLTEEGEFLRRPLQREMYRAYKEMMTGYESNSETEGDSDSFTNGILDICENVDGGDPGDFVVKLKNCITVELRQKHR